MIWLEFGACFIGGVLIALSFVVGISLYAIKHPDKMMPHIMAAMRKRRQ